MRICLPKYIIYMLMVQGYVMSRKKPFFLGQSSENSTLLSAVISSVPDDPTWIIRVDHDWGQGKNSKWWLKVLKKITLKYQISVESPMNHFLRHLQVRSFDEKRIHLYDGFLMAPRISTWGLRRQNSILRKNLSDHSSK